MDDRGARRAVLALCLWLIAPARPRACAAQALPLDFENGGPGIAQMLSGIKSDLALHPELVAQVPGQALKPVVVTVSGMEEDKLGRVIELGQILRVWHWLFPGQKPPDEEEVGRRLSGICAENPAAAAPQSRKPENYLQLDLEKAAQRNGLDVDVVNFYWSRDPKETGRTVEMFERELLALRDDERTRGRPLYIVAHSWGTVLIHDALLRLDEQGQTIVVRRLVTLGSPLVPRRLFVRLFKDFHDLVDRLQHRVTRPAGVRQWVNLWAQWDPYSEPIALADANIQVDLQAQPYEAKLKALVPAVGAAAVKSDLKALEDSAQWHESYRRGFRASLRTLGEDVSWDILQQNLPEVLPSRS
jgi:hypothetical protein